MLQMVRRIDVKQSPETSQSKASPSGESFELWRRLAKARLQEHERERERVLSTVLEAIRELAQHYTWADLYIFGSITSPGRFHPRSDVDIAVRGLNKFDHFAFIGDISLLIGRSVDVVRLEDCRITESITSKGLKWQGKEP
jgi:predicted nucleotidyltransferase